MASVSASPNVLSRLQPLVPPRTATLRLMYRANGRIFLKSPPTSVWRGQLGEFLHRIAPAHHHDNDLSLYQRLFRTPRTAVDVPTGFDDRTLGRLGLAGAHVPHPFVMRMASSPVPGEPVEVQPGETVGVEMTLMEGAIETVPSLCAAFESLAADGIGSKTKQPGGRRRRGRAVLTAATLQTGAQEHPLYDGSQWTLPPRCSADLLPKALRADDVSSDRPVTLACWTPLRLTHRRRVVEPDDVSVAALGAAYFRRLVGLAVCYGPEPLPSDAVKDLLDAFFALGDATTLDASDMQWASDSRYSARQGKRHPTGGLVGSIRLSGTPDVNRSWRFLAEATASLHLGKKTALGLGYVEPVPG